MQKDRSVLKMLDTLAEKLDPKTWTVIDHWDADRFAVGVAKKTNPKLLVYVSTHEQAEGRFCFECEVQADRDDSEYRVVRKEVGVDVDSLVSAILAHFA
jgi:hypothetical protein